MKVPDGIVGDPGDPGRRPLTLGITVALLSVTSVAVFSRAFVKARVVKQFQIEDYLLIAGLLGFAGFVGVVLEAGNHGNGKHQWNVSREDVAIIKECYNVMEIAFGCALLVTKLANIIQLKRIFVPIGHSGFLYRLLQFLAFAHIISTVALTLAFVFQCWPREKIWSRSVPGRCISGTRNVIIGAAIPSLFDWMMLIIPLIGMRGNKAMKSKTKVRIYLILLVALFASIASLLRLAYSIIWARGKNTTWDAQPVVWWGAAEISALLVIICFPTMPRFYQYLRHLGHPPANMYTSQLDHPTRRNPTIYSEVDMHDDCEDLRFVERVDSWSYRPSQEGKSMSTERKGSVSTIGESPSRAHVRDSSRDREGRGSPLVRVGSISWDPEFSVREATMGPPLEARYY